MWPILLRNLMATWIICGVWDWFLYFSPLSEKLQPYKVTQARPALSQIKHDALHTTIASCCGTAVEWVLCHFYATGYFSIQRNMMETPYWNAIAILFITHWRIPHFYVIHRGMHPWNNPNLPDVGRFLYKWVHSLHHKSYNPTAFSGTSMHWFEATAYYSASLCIVPFGVNPAIPLACIIDCGVGAWLGHDGFSFPGSTDVFHMRHHTSFDCNYGAQHVPIDKWVGTFAADEDSLDVIWADQKDNVGAKGNTTATHKAAGVKVE
jgi:sterol desaturase/sphingolipid hydroxylase (fatty acid hydroxylase superfamily)